MEQFAGVFVPRPPPVPVRPAPLETPIPPPQTDTVSIDPPPAPIVASPMPTDTGAAAATTARPTDGLDIFSALGLLLQPDGILAKNELYFEKMSSIFDYSTQITFWDVPVICYILQHIGMVHMSYKLLYN